MTKQQVEKEKQGYNEVSIVAKCSNCVHFRSEISLENCLGFQYGAEKNIHCNIGKFKVKKTAVCMLHDFKE